MRIGVVVENEAPFVFDEVLALREIGVGVDVASVFRPLPRARWERVYEGDVAYPERGLAGWTRSALPGARAPGRALALVRAARREGAPLRLALLAATLAERARSQGWTHVHASFATYPAWVAWATGQLADLPFSFTGHAYDVQDPRPWLARLVGEARFVRAISEETALRLRRVAGADAAVRVRVGHLGVDVERFRPGPPAVRRDPPEILSVAQLGPTKGLEVLLDAAARLASDGARFRVTILGEGPMRSALEARIHALGVADRVRLAGAASRDAVRRALARASVFALPCTVVGGRRHDGLPVALLEAMAAGLPVVSTPVGGIPEAVIDGACGRLVPPGDAAALAAALSALLRDPATRARLGAAARKRVVERFRREDAARRLAVWIAEGAAPAARKRASVAPRPLGARV